MRVILFVSFFTLCSSTHFLSQIFWSVFGAEKNNKQSTEIQKDPGCDGLCGVTPKSCPNSQYRCIDGSCNNLKIPSWGTPNMCYSRLLRNRYSDGVYALPTAKSGNPLVSARKITLLLFKDKQVHDTKLTLNAMQWGQLIAHDLSLSVGIGFPTCCVNGKNFGIDPRCANIPVPASDDVYKGQQCLNFLRTMSTKDNICTPNKNPASPLSGVTAFMDASFVYGSSDSQAKSLREMKCGRMKTETRNGQEWPPQASNPLLTCNVKIFTEPCYQAGDGRVNQNTELSMLQVMFLRKHNKIADYLCEVNKQWNDDKIYEETRRIIYSYFQHVNYYELLPYYLGRNNMLKKKLIYDNPQGYINDYNPNTNPGVTVEYATAAFRHIHSSVYGSLKMYSEDRKYINEVRLSSWLLKPSILEESANFDGFARGMSTEPQLESDPYFDKEITNYLFKGDNEFGEDLRALDVQRARDHGVPTYNDLREYCGFPRAKKFSDFYDKIQKEHVDIISKIYEVPDDVDLVVGGSLETKSNGAEVGPTFLCILLEQFYRTRTGDRYFYELGDEAGAFTPEQLSAIRNGSTIASIFCEVSGVKNMQPKALELISIKNPLVSCDQIPTINLTFWKDNSNTTTA